MKMGLYRLGAAAAGIGAVLGLQQPARAQDFETDVRPILERHCVDCHGPKKQESMLRLDGRGRVLAGGMSGDIVVPGKSGESLLVQHLTGAARPRMPFDVPGGYRHALPHELGLADKWAEDFAAAAHGPAGTAHTLRAHVEAGRVGFWVDGGRPVSMAYASTANGGVTRISGVWTPPELRGNGYASAVVTALSNERMDAGESCMLNTDLANPTSNKIYQALGYRRIGDSITIDFLRPHATR